MVVHVYVVLTVLTLYLGESGAGTHVLITGTALILLSEREWVTET